MFHVEQNEKFIFILFNQKDWYVIAVRRMASPKVYVFLRIDYIAFASILVNLTARERPTTKSFAFGPPPYSAKPNRDDRLRVTSTLL